jgi:hypothetical protein
MSRPVTVQEVVARIPAQASGKVRGFFWALVAVGVLAFGITVVANPMRAWSAMLLNLTYWLTLAQAGVVLAAVFYIVKAKWAIPFTRIALGTGSFLPWAFLLLVVTLLFGSPHLFSWIAEPLPAKAAYLNLPFLYARQFGLVGGMLLLSWVFLRRIRRLDAGLAREHATGAHKARFEKWSAGWKGNAPELAAAGRVLPRLAGAMIPAYAATFTVVCWDLVMSLDPHWATTMIGGMFFMAGILMGFASLAFLSLQLRRAYGLEAFLTPERYHQLGKLIFGFSIFWTYLFWSMFLPIWYANMPEESNWMVLRARPPFLPWSVAAIGLTWFVPFTGFMNLAAKKNPMTHLFFATVVLAGLWVERLVLTYPSLFHDMMPVGFPEVGVTLGFLGAFGLSFQAYASTRPLVALDQLDGMSEDPH